MKKETVVSDNAPQPIGPYSQAVKAGNLLFLSGQIAIDPKTGQLKTHDLTEETEQIMENLKAVLKAAGSDLGSVVKTSIFLKEISAFGQVNEVYGKYFKSDFPARETVAVKSLPKDVNVEISMIAVI